MAREITAPELTLLRAEKQWSKLRAAIYAPGTVYTARVNQTFSSLDKIKQVTYDGGSGTLSDVKIGMTMLIGSSAGGFDIGMVRLRATPTSSIFYFNESSEIIWADNLYLTVIADFDLWARHLTTVSGVTYVDGDITYSDQHTDFDPVPVMGSHRVLKLVAGDCSADFDGSDSWVIDSSITAYSWVAPTASSSSGMATATPTIHWDTVGWHLVYLQVTAANGKSFAGVRYVYVWDDDHAPASVQLTECSGDTNEGGWHFKVTMVTGAEHSFVRDRALVILFAEDYYGDTNQSIGPLEGSENVICIGRIAGETIHWNSESGTVEFNVQGAQEWMKQIKGFPSGLTMVTGTPSAWTQMTNLTVDRALFHFFHWRTTATKIMDVYLTNDTRLIPDFSAQGAKLWNQISNFIFNKIFANLGVDRYGRLFAEIDPQMVPQADRTWPIVMEITKADWMETPSIERSIVPETGLVDMSAVYLNTSKKGSTFYMLAPGHMQLHFGDDKIVDNVAGWDNQADNNQMAGLMFGWMSNEFPQMDFQLAQNNRMIDCWPRQFVSTDIAEGDTPRGIAYDGNMIPRSVSFKFNPESGFLNVDIAFEAETFERNAIKGDVPGSPSDVSNPPSTSFPPLPEFPILLPGEIPPISGAAVGPKKVLYHDADKGLVFSENFNSDSPTWQTVNSGLTEDQYQGLNKVIVTPGGQVYVARRSQNVVFWLPFEPFIARAPSIGATFEIVEDVSSIGDKFPGFETPYYGVVAIAANPTQPDTVLYIVNGQVSGDSVSKCYMMVNGGAPTYTGLTIMGIVNQEVKSLSYGFGKWRLTAAAGFGSNYWVLNSGATAVVDSGTLTGDRENVHIPIVTSDKTIHGNFANDTNIEFGSGNISSMSDPGGSEIYFTDDRGKLACDPTGMFLMADQQHDARRGKSSDGGATWSTPGLSLPVVGAPYYVFAYVSGTGVKSCWIAGQSVLMCSNDFGTTWVDKAGDIDDIVVLIPQVREIIVVEI